MKAEEVMVEEKDGGLFISLSGDTLVYFMVLAFKTATRCFLPTWAYLIVFKILSLLQSKGWLPSRFIEGKRHLINNEVTKALSEGINNEYSGPKGYQSSI